MGLKFYSQRAQAVLISVDTSSGCFSCLLDLACHPASMELDLVLGRDWFNYCTTAIEDAHLFLADGRRLVFNASPFHAVLAESDLLG